MTSLYYRQIPRLLSYVICTSVNREPLNEAENYPVFPLPSLGINILTSYLISLRPFTFHISILESCYIKRTLPYHKLVMLLFLITPFVFFDSVRQLSF